VVKELWRIYSEILTNSTGPFIKTSKNNRFWKTGLKSKILTGGKAMKTKIFSLVFIFVFSIGLLAQIREGTWGVSGFVGTTVTDAEYTYIAGNFGYVGPSTGKGAKLTTDNAFPDLSYPYVDGEIVECVPDGEGGWYIGGEFSHVGEVERKNIAQINADGTVSPWNPGANGEVCAIAVDGNAVYVGGYFTRIGGANLEHLAKLRKSDGTPYVDWAPNPDQTVYALAVQDTFIFVGGSFRKISGLYKRNLVKMRISDAGIVENWSAQPGNTVYTMALSGDQLFIGGLFTFLWGQGPAYYVARVSAETGMMNRPLFDPHLNGYVYDIAVDGDDVYLAGEFTQVGNDTILIRYRLARVSGTNGNGDILWDPEPNDLVKKVRVHDGKVYVVGYFTRIGTKVRNHIARLTGYWGEADDSWNPNADGSVNCMAFNGNNIYIGGLFESVGGKSFSNIARFRNVDFSLDTTWHPNPGGSVSTVASDGKFVYFGGDFYRVGERGIDNLARVDWQTGALDTLWYPKPNDAVKSLALSDDAVFIGGNFTMVGNTEIKYLAKISKATGGVVSDWNPNPAGDLNGGIGLVKINGDFLYASGRFYDNSFTTVINYFRRIYLNESLVDTSWIPNPNGTVWTIGFDGEDVYVGGDFRQIGGEERKGLAKLSLTDASPCRDWAVDIGNGLVETLLPRGEFLYVGGSFEKIGGWDIKYLARVDKKNGETDRRWVLNPESRNILNPEICSLSLTGNNLIIGGIFGKIEGMVVNNFAVYDLGPVVEPVIPDYISLGTGASANHSTVIRKDGRVFAWGENTNGALGDNSTENRFAPVASDTTGVLRDEKIVKIAQGNGFTLALTERGRVFAWGKNDHGQLGNNSTVDSYAPVAVDTTGVLAGKRIVDIAAGDKHALALDENGAMYAWGDNSYGELGNDSSTDSSVPVEVYVSRDIYLQTIIAVAAGKDFSLALSREGHVFAWGKNRSGQLGNNGYRPKFVPVLVDTSGVLSGKEIIAIAAGEDHAVAVSRNGRVFAWGGNYYGQLGNGNTTNSNVPVAVDTSGILGGKIIVSVMAGNGHTLALDLNGNLYAWGRGDFGQLGTGNTLNSSLPVSVDMNGALTGKTIVRIATGANHSLALSSDGTVFTWGDNTYGQLGINAPDSAKSTVPVPVVWNVTYANGNLGMPEKFRLEQNYPNPFNPTTTIKYSIPPSAVWDGKANRHAVRVTLYVYNSIGQKVAILVDEKQAPGNYTVSFDAKSLASGIYFYTLRAGNYEATKKMILLK
jgi:alpha-tubulin suppressor-like RCC1 family protein